MDEFYSIPNKRCEKLSLKSRFSSRTDDYLSDILTMLDIDNDKYPNLVSPESYNITKIGTPNCSEEMSTETILINIPFDAVNEDLDYNDNFNAVDFLIDYPSHDLFETTQYKYHSFDSYCVDITFKETSDQYFAIVAIFCKRPLNEICEDKKCLRFCCENPSQVVVQDESSQDISSIFLSFSS